MLTISLEIQVPQSDNWGFNFIPSIQIYRKHTETALYVGWFLWGFALMFKEVA
jgi:hypothetical protein